MAVGGALWFTKTVQSYQVTLKWTPVLNRKQSVVYHHQLFSRKNHQNIWLNVFILFKSSGRKMQVPLPFFLLASSKLHWHVKPVRSEFRGPIFSGSYCKMYSAISDTDNHLLSAPLSCCDTNITHYQVLIGSDSENKPKRWKGKFYKNREAQEISCFKLLKYRL